jgi:predicted O-methyltransferase YrrM
MAGRSDGHEIARRIGERIDETYSRGSVLGDDGNLHEIGLISVNRYRGNFIADLVRSERPHATLEVGMAWGLSTLFILQALAESGDEFRPHVVIDPRQSATYSNAANRSLRDLGIADLVEFHEEPSELALPQLVREKRQFDLAFIDGSHQFDHVFIDLRFVHRLLRAGGLVIFDDSNWSAVHLACRFAESNYGYSLFAEPAATGSHRRRRRFRAKPIAPVQAYRKPMQEVSLPQGYVAPFFEGFEPRASSHTGELRHKGLMALAAGDRVLARRNFVEALRHEPTRLKIYLRLLRTFLPLKAAQLLSAKSRRHAART